MNAEIQTETKVLPNKKPQPDLREKLMDIRRKSMALTNELNKLLKIESCEKCGKRK